MELVKKGVLRKSDRRGMKQRKNDGLNFFRGPERRCTNIGGSSRHSLVGGHQPTSLSEGEGFVTDTTPSLLTDWGWGCLHAVVSNITSAILFPGAGGGRGGGLEEEARV